ncbi:hypothetical protein ABZ154_06680 [Streptomyces sp. NPDC006261]|uniref:hypothetical protein n=1 Tax=Streptomyces sp. NPDC006261 TaxID=3156739 RepID=UPI0033AD64D4
MPQTPRLIRRDDFRPLVDHRTVHVGTMWFDEPPADDERIQVPGAGLYLSTVHNDHYPLVRLESWSGEPPEPEPEPGARPRRGTEVPRAGSA